LKTWVWEKHTILGRSRVGGCQPSLWKKKSECWSLFHIPPPPWEIEGLTAKAFGGFDLVRTNRSFPENYEPVLQTPRGLANVGLRPRTLVAVKKCRFESRFLSEPAGKDSPAGLVTRVGSITSFVARLGFRQQILTTDLRLISPLLHQPRRHRPTYRHL